MAYRRTIAEENIDGAGLATIRAIVFDPETGVARFVDLPTLPGDPPRHGPQLQPDALVGLLGTKVIEQREVFDGEVLLVGASGLPWHLGFDGPHRGPGVLLHYDKATDSYSDTRWTLERVADVVMFEEAEESDEDEEEHVDATPAI